MRTLLLPALALGLFAAACAPDKGRGTGQDDVIDGRVEVPEPPVEGKGVQFVMPETIIPAGEEKMMCWIPDWVPERDSLVRSFIGLQGGMGHHIVALTSGIPREAGTTFDCTELEAMVSLEPLLVPDNPPGEKTDVSVRLFPEDFAVRLPAGARIVLQSHYVNVADRDLLVADVAVFDFVEEGEAYTEASYFTVNHGGIDLPEGDVTTSVSCEVARRTQLVSLFGHMHDWGTSVKIEREREGTTKVLYEVEEWTVE